MYEFYKIYSERGLVHTMNQYTYDKAVNRFFEICEQKQIPLALFGVTLGEEEFLMDNMF